MRPPAQLRKHPETIDQTHHHHPLAFPFCHCIFFFSLLFVFASDNAALTTCHSWAELHGPRRPRGPCRRHHHLRGERLLWLADGMGVYHVYAGESNGIRDFQVVEAAFEVSV
jgi:hypothetical protein